MWRRPSSPGPAARRLSTRPAPTTKTFCALSARPRPPTAKASWDAYGKSLLTASTWLSTPQGALPDLIEITGSPDNVVTIADYNAHDYGVRLSGGGERSYQALGQAARLFEEGEFSMPVAQTFPLEQAAEAHRISQDGHLCGKLVLIVDE